MTDSLIEKVARAIENADMSAANQCDRCKGSGYHHGFGEHGHDPDWCSVCGGSGYVDDPLVRARAALLAIEGAGYAITPIEPTNDMIARASEQMPIEYEYRTMLSDGQHPDYPRAMRMVAVGYAKPKDRTSPKGVYAALLSSRPRVTG